MNGAMRTFGYWLGVGLLIAGAAAGAAELFALLQGGTSSLSPGAIWFRLHGNSLVGFQALIEKGPLPWLWAPIQYVLTVPAWALLIPPGLLLVVLCRLRARA
jgi:hypothetical protein